MSRIRSTCSEYLDYSNIHGLRYLSDKNRTWVERLWWLVMILSSMYGCVRMISNVHDKWLVSPVIISISETAIPISEIPFPSVTICPQTKTKKKIFNLTNVLDRMTREGLSIYDLTEIEQNRLAVLSQLCGHYKSHIPAISEKNIDCSKCIENMIEMMPRREELIFGCFFRLNSLCVENFTQVITDEGVCYTFNGVNLTSVYRDESITDDSFSTEQWTLEEGYKPNVSLKTYPHRALSSGKFFGLSLVVRLPDEDFDPFCKGPIPGFTSVMHTPYTTPSGSKNSVKVSLNQEVTIKMKPKSIITSNNLKKYSPGVRQCFFTHERYLRFFKTYTQQNCEVECITNATISKCGCIRFYMPTSSGIQICGMTDFNCTNHVIFNQVLDNAKKICNCLPACTSLTFDLELIQASFEANKYAQSIGAQPNDGFSYSSIIIIFVEEQFFPFRRSELYGFIDFVANCGGLLGLFLGGSLISIVEIIYFCTLRVLCTWRLQRRRPTRLSPVFVLRNSKETITFGHKQLYF